MSIFWLTVLGYSPSWWGRRDGFQIPFCLQFDSTQFILYLWFLEALVQMATLGDLGLLFKGSVTKYILFPFSLFLKVFFPYQCRVLVYASTFMCLKFTTFNCEDCNHL